MLFAVAAAVLALGVILLFDTGQVTKKKVRLNNAADAAAYSLAVQQARAMNYAAMMNRARAANEAVIAQAVSLWSAANAWHAHSVYGNAASHKAIDFTELCEGDFNTTPKYTNFVCGILTQNGWTPNPVTYPAMNVLWGTSQWAHTFYWLEEFEQGTNRMDIQGTLAGVVEKTSNANKHFSDAAEYMFDGLAHFGYFTAQDTVRQFDEHALIAGLNTNGGPDIESVGWAVLRGDASPNVGLLYANNGYLDHGSQRRFRDVVMGSRDGFAAERNQQDRDPRDFDYGPGALIWRASGRWSGGTDMSDGFDRWIGADAMDADIGFFGGWIFNQNESGVLGHGGAQAGIGGWDREFDGIKHAGEYSRSEKGWYSDDHARDYAQWGSIGGEHTGGNTQLGRVHRYPSVNEDPDGEHDDPLWAEYRGHRGDTDQIDENGTHELALGNYNNRQNAFFNGYQGLHEYDDTGGSGAPPLGEGSGPVMSVYVISPRESARASEDIDGIAAPAGGVIRLESGLDKYTAVASGQAYFNRPTDKQLFPRMIRQQWRRGLVADTRQLEYGSTFSPYWQARLVETPRSVLQYIDENDPLPISGDIWD